MSSYSLNSDCDSLNSKLPSNSNSKSHTPDIEHEWHEFNSTPGNIRPLRDERQSSKSFRRNNDDLGLPVSSTNGDPMQLAKHPATPKARKTIALTDRIIKEIQNSLTIFKPSKSLSMLSKLTEEVQETALAEIDLVCSGGGMKGYFMCGCYAILEHELSKRKVRIARVSGASAGAWAGLFICLDLGTIAWIETYYAYKDASERMGATVHEAYDVMYASWIRQVLPEDAYKKCNGRLFISITVVGAYGKLENHMISEFFSNDDLYDCCCASSTIPFITERWGTRHFRGMRVIDGSFTNDLPIFKDNRRRQLVIRLGELDYAVRLLATSQDDCIEVLVIRGSLLMSQFLEGNKITNAIAWLDKNENSKELIRNKHNDLYDRILQGLEDNKYVFLCTTLLLTYCMRRESSLKKIWIPSTINACHKLCGMVWNSVLVDKTKEMFKYWLMK